MKVSSNVLLFQPLGFANVSSLPLHKRKLNPPGNSVSFFLSDDYPNNFQKCSKIDQNIQKSRRRKCIHPTKPTTHPTITSTHHIHFRFYFQSISCTHHKLQEPKRTIYTYILYRDGGSPSTVTHTHTFYERLRFRHWPVSFYHFGLS